MKTLLRLLRILAVSVLLALPVSAATTYSLVWVARPASDNVTSIKIYKRTGTTYTLLDTLTPATVKWLIPNAVSGDVYAAEAVNAAGPGLKAEVTVQTVPGQLNVRVLIEITP